MRDVARKYPTDLDAQTLYAEALMNLAVELLDRPRRSRERRTDDLAHARARESGPEPPRRNPSLHPRSRSAVPEAGGAADRLAKMMPGAGHLVHMPSHIYKRAGRYDPSHGTIRPRRQDETYFHARMPGGMYAATYYLHN